MSIAKEIIVTQAVKRLLPLLGSISESEKNAERFFRLAERLAPNEYSRAITKALQENKWLLRILGRAVPQLSPNCRDRLLTNFIFRQFWYGSVRRSEARNKERIRAPWFFIISPTMRCNLRCQGCYAGSYDPRDDLEFEVIDRVLNEGKELGIHFITVLGGEPFVRKDLWDICQRHSDITFQVYTNGTLIDKEAARRLERLGNVALMVSIEGFEAETDARRGKGIFQKAMQAMDNLREVGIPFGFSATVTRYNMETIISDEFNDMMVDRGCLVGWHFLYLPVGRDPDPSLMPTPEQRLIMQTRGGTNISHRKPILVIDFWNDGPLVGGCLAGGRHYFHINSHGDVEPCVYVHFAVDNVKEKSLREILESPFFRGIRSRQPYTDNLLRPCMIMDHPHILRQILAEFKPYSTCPGAESLITTLSETMDQYAKESARVLDPVWERDFSSGYKCWT